MLGLTLHTVGGTQVLDMVRNLSLSLLLLLLCLFQLLLWYLACSCERSYLIVDSLNLLRESIWVHFCGYGHMPLVAWNCYIGLMQISVLWILFPSFGEG